MSRIILSSFLRPFSSTEAQTDQIMLYTQNTSLSSGSYIMKLELSAILRAFQLYDCSGIADKSMSK